MCLIHFGLLPYLLRLLLWLDRYNTLIHISIRISTNKKFEYRSKVNFSKKESKISSTRLSCTYLIFKGNIKEFILKIWNFTSFLAYFDTFYFLYISRSNINVKYSMIFNLIKLNLPGDTWKRKIFNQSARLFSQRGDGELSMSASRQRIPKKYWNK